MYLSFDQNCSPLWDTLPRMDVMKNKKIPYFQLFHDSDIFSYDYKISYNTSKVGQLYSKSSNAFPYSPVLSYFQFFGKYLPIDSTIFKTYMQESIIAFTDRNKLSKKKLAIRLTEIDKYAILANFGSTKVGYKLSKEFYKDTLDELLDFAYKDLINWCIYKPFKNDLEILIKGDKETYTSLDTSNLNQLYNSWLPALKCGGEVNSGTDFFHLKTSKEKNYTFFISFVEEYHTFAYLYNTSIDETSSYMKKLDINCGELPFYAIAKRNHGFKRINKLLYINGKLIIDEVEFLIRPLNWEELSAKLIKIGIIAIIGKAVALHLQVRNIDSGFTFITSKGGSPYRKLVKHYSNLLKKEGLYNGLKNSLEIEFNTIEQLKYLKNKIKLPVRLRNLSGYETMAGRDYSEFIKEQITLGNKGLEALKNSTETSDLKKLQKMELYWYLSNLKYWDNRGAIRYWTTAVGGNDFYKLVIKNSRIIQSI